MCTWRQFKEHTPLFQKVSNIATNWVSHVCDLYRNWFGWMERYQVWVEKVAAVRSLLSVSKSSPIQTMTRGDKISGSLGLLLQYSNCVLIWLIGRHCDLCVIIEYCPYGNMLQFLRKRRGWYEPTWLTPSEDPDKQFSVTDLVSAAFQVARAMEFLVSRKVRLK